MTGVVIKLGTSSLTDDDGVLDSSVIDRVCDQVAQLRATGTEVTIVTSGAIAAGMPLMGISAADRPSDTVTLQALSALGQPALLAEWGRALRSHSLSVGQILLAPHNFGDRDQYLHARSTLERLHGLGIVPLINENDAVTDAAIRYGDNDRIAALVATLIQADTLILLTDTDGVLTADPRIDPSASLIDEIVEFDQQLEDRAGGAGSARGSGGMASKLTAAKIAAWSGVRTVIANAERNDVIIDAVANAPGVGTVVQPRSSRLTARKIWIGFAMPSRGTLHVDAGAHNALAGGGNSVLAVGISSTDGSFERGDAVDVAGPDKAVFAKGIVRASSSDLAEETASVVIHADDLVVIA